MGEGQREGERESQAGPALSAGSPTRGSNSRNMTSRSEPKSDAQRTEPPRRPIICIYHYFSLSHLTTEALPTLPPPTPKGSVPQDPAPAAGDAFLSCWPKRSCWKKKARTPPSQGPSARLSEEHRLEPDPDPVRCPAPPFPGRVTLGRAVLPRARVGLLRPVCRAVRMRQSRAYTPCPRRPSQASRPHLSVPHYQQ